MKKFKIIVCGAVAAAIAAVSVVAAETETTTPNDATHPQRHRHQMMRKLTEIGVTDAQRDQIRAIVRESAPNIRPLAQQMRQERRTLHEATQASPVNEPAIRAQAARVAQLQADLAVKRAYMRERIHAVLTPEQAAKLKEMAAKHRGEFRRHHDV